MRKFLKNQQAISVLYDAVLFVVMVSLSGAVLIPALQNDNAVQTTIDTHRENIAEETLLTMLVSKIDKFTYNSGIQSFEQLHKTFANLIAENLACRKTSFFVGDFTTKLEKEIKNFLNNYLGDKYGFSFQAKWEPANLGKITISLGSTIPEKNCYIAKTQIMMPYNTVEDFKKAFGHCTGLSASNSDLPSIQKAEVKLILWEVKG
jgi:hypothetical protein